MSTFFPNTPRSNIQHALRTALKDDRRTAAIKEVTGWDESQVSRIKSDQQGIVLSKLDAVVEAAGFVLVTRRYLDAISTLSEVGVHCECARSGVGECGGLRSTSPADTNEVQHF